MTKSSKRSLVDIEKKLRDIFNFSEVTYQQPRDSNKDNQAFITICTNIGKVIKELTHAPTAD